MSFGMVAAGLGAAASVKSLTSKGGGGGGSTASKDPWGPAAPWLEKNLQTGQDLQNYYQQNPFNDMQKTAYQNQFSQNDRFNNELFPALMQQMGGLLGPNFQMPASYKPGGAQAQQAGLLAAAPQTGPNGQPAQYANPSFGLINWAAQNPFTNGGITDKTVKALTPEEESAEAKKKREEEERQRAWEDELRGAGAA
jgi:hypothetical protein